MNLRYVFEHRFFGTPEGSVWTDTSYEAAFWERYLTVFDCVTVVARVQPVLRPLQAWKRADGPQVRFHPVHYYQGPFHFLRQAPRVLLTMRSAVRVPDAIIFRVPSQLSLCVRPPLPDSSHPFGLEVVGDPNRVFGPSVSRHPLRRFFRWWFSSGLRRQCLQACAVSYVAKYLERLYPASGSTFRTQYSDAQLSPEAFSSASSPRNGEVRLITIGSLDQYYKGTDVLLDAMAICRSHGLNANLTIIGDGCLRSNFEAHAARLGLTESVHFVGSLPSGKPVRDYLSAATLFLLPSLTEGLSRALLEAMACGLPCIASAVGGTPEVLGPGELVRPGDAEGLAAKISELLTAPRRMAYLSNRNRTIARRFQESRSARRRTAFCQTVKLATSEWLKRKQTPSAPTK
jgi:glycosyltransferase involved in cell wall biosynthesis